MIETTRGLPNTCSQCGTPVKKEDGWLAENEDVARSGGGICKKCARKGAKPMQAAQPADEKQAEQAAEDQPSDQDEAPEAES